MITVQQRKFDPEFKRRAVEKLINSDKSGSEIAEELGVTADLLYKWKRKLQADPQSCFPGKGHRQPGIPAEEELRAFEAGKRGTSHGARYIKRSGAHLYVEITTEVKCRIIRELEHKYCVAKMCRLLHVSCVSCYRYKHGWVGIHSQKEAKLKQIVLAVFMKNDARYGSPRIKESLKNAGMCVSKHRFGT